MKKLFFPFLLLALAGLTIAQVRRISDEPTLTTIGTNDEVIVNQWTGSAYVTKRAKARSLLAADVFVFLGDSYAAEDLAGAGSSIGPASGTGNSWPTRLAQTSNYSHYSGWFNYATNSATTVTLSNWYQFTAATNTWDPILQNAYLFFNAGQNDDNSATNPWTQIMIQARAKGYKIIAMTSPTNQLTAPTHMYFNTNNLYIRARSDLYDYLVDVDLLVTNRAAQFDAGTGHPSKAFNQNLANYICQTIVPAHAPLYGFLPPERYHTYDILTVRSNLDTAGLAVRGFGIGVTGARTEISNDGLGNGTIQSIDPSGNYGLIYNQGNPSIFSKGQLQISGSASLAVGPSAALLTNILVASAVLDFPSTGSMTNSDLSIAFNLGTTNDVAIVQVPPSMQLKNSFYSWWITNGLVWVRYNNYLTNAAQDPPAGLVNAMIIKR